ncbi:hypothetical protein [Saccharicrinis aurantiacus]|uniref:hypothetical protein n=1 Tax=Saccharicrinis aurantiacus TaxID=1849719 RepID=UPI00094F5FE2|nr:hypothetical protein [Saccharicrinis aurantiacus]
MEQNEQLVKVSKWVKPRLNKLELFLVPVFILFYSLTEYISSAYEIIIVAPLGILGIFYFLSAFYPNEDAKFTELAKVISKVSAISLSVTAIGIIYTIMHLPGSKSMLLVTIPSVAIAIILFIYFKKSEPSIKLFDNRMLLRLAISLLASIFLVFIV